MNSSKKTLTLAVTSALLAALFSVSSSAADAIKSTPVAARSTFDGNIRNNSLALSPDEATAVVSYSERSDIIVYNLQANTVRGVLPGYVVVPAKAPQAAQCLH